MYSCPASIIYTLQENKHFIEGVCIYHTCNNLDVTPVMNMKESS